MIRVEPAQCYASLFAHPEGRVLACISNLSKVQARVQVTLDLTKLGLRPGAPARDALTGVPVTMTGGRAVIDILSQDYRLLWLQ